MDEFYIKHLNEMAGKEIFYKYFTAQLSRLHLHFYCFYQLMEVLSADFLPIMCLQYPRFNVHHTCSSSVEERRET